MHIRIFSVTILFPPVLLLHVMLNLMNVFFPFHRFPHLRLILILPAFKTWSSAQSSMSCLCMAMMACPCAHCCLFVGPLQTVLRPSRLSWRISRILLHLSWCASRILPRPPRLSWRNIHILSRLSRLTCLIMSRPMVLLPGHLALMPVVAHAPIPPPPVQPSHSMVTRSKSGIFKPHYSVDLTSTALLSALTSTSEPRDFKSAAKHSKWVAAMQQEIATL